MALVLRRVYGVSLYTIDADGGNLRRILSLPDFTFLGSPDWSPDGRKIAVNSWRPTMGEGCGNARVFVVNADGSSLKDLGLGAMPSWSPDGKQLTCTRYAKQQEGLRGGIWIMNADGTGGQPIDDRGWAPMVAQTQRDRVHHPRQRRRTGRLRPVQAATPHAALGKRLFANLLGAGVVARRKVDLFQGRSGRRRF